MELLNNLVGITNEFLWSKVLIIMLIVLGIYFTFRTNFVQFRFFGEMFRLLGDGAKGEKKEGAVSSFQAFCISTASRVGTGNIAGIAMAVVAGGPGSVFWMWLIALIGSASSFVESTLAQIFKIKDGEGFRGGPAYYMEQGLKNRTMGIVFSILITICFGFIFNAVQSNTITAAFNNAFGMDRLVLGLILATLTGIIIFGGVHRVAKVSEVIVPIFAVLYILVSLFVVVINIGEIPGIIKTIFESAFGLREMAVGSMSGMILVGIKRGLFSNEAGMGSAPNAAATASVSHPVKQGLIQTLAVFNDTLIICSCTAFIILLSDIDLNSGLTGIQLTQNALTSQIGSFGSTFIAICILLFAFSSIVGNYYYGESNIEFLTTNRVYINIYRVLVAAMVMFGSVARLDIVWNLADIFMAFMAIINLIAIILLSKIAFAVLDDYRKQKESGIKDPIFKAECIKYLKNADEWK